VNLEKINLSNNLFKTFPTVLEQLPRVNIVHLNNDFMIANKGHNQNNINYRENWEKLLSLAGKSSIERIYIQIKDKDEATFIRDSFRDATGKDKSVIAYKLSDAPIKRVYMTSMAGK